MSEQQRLANYLEQHLDELAPELNARAVRVQDERLAALVKVWLENHVAILRNKPCKMGEWAAQFVERHRDLGILTGDAYQCIQTMRKSLIEKCVGKIEDVSDAQVISCLTDSAADIEQATVEYFAQRIREDTVVNQRRQKAILESVDEPMAIIQAEGGIEEVNRAFARLFKTTPDALTGLDINSLCDEDTSSRLRSFMRQKKLEQNKGSFPGRLKFGSQTVNAKINCQPFFDGDGLRTGAAVFIEHEEKSADIHAGIRYLEERMFPLIPLPLQVFDTDRAITYSSEPVASLPFHGYEKKEPLCCFLYRNRHGDQHPCPCGNVLGSGQFFLDEISYDTQSEVKWYRVLILPLLDDEGNIVRAVTCLYDSTYRRQLHKQLESQIINQQRSSLVAQLSITVAHQLRNPLSVVLGFAEMMSKGLAPDQYAEAVSRILRNSLRCKDIVENLLDFGKGMPLERRPVDFEALIRETVRPLLTPAQNRLIEWRFSGKPAPIECVPEQMTQIVLSLIDNALRVANKQVLCSLENKGELIRLRVLDDGPGISLDLRDRIFEPFFTTRREEGATGLGLSLARAVATDYGGSLTVSAPAANEPRGACLVLQLPLMKKSAEATPDETSEKKAEFAEKRVLIVDDETDLQDLLKTTLYLRGYRADSVSTGMEALEKLKQEEYSAVVLDYLLKGSLSGQQLYREIAEQYPALVPRILFITADMLNYQTRLFVESTGRPVLEKPFLMADFMTELGKLMG